MASGWNLLVWLECKGVASGYCCKEVTYPYFACIGSFLQQHHYFFVHFKTVFSFFIYIIK